MLASCTFTREESGTDSGLLLLSKFIEYNQRVKKAKTSIPELTPLNPDNKDGENPATIE